MKNSIRLTGKSNSTYLVIIIYSIQGDEIILTLTFVSLILHESLDVHLTTGNSVNNCYLLFGTTVIMLVHLHSKEVATTQNKPGKRYNTII